MATLRRIPVPLRILLAIALVELLAWTVATAPFQGPDENNHFAYAQQLAETGSKPSFGSGSQTISEDEGSALATLNLWQLIGNTQAKPAWSPLDLKVLRNLHIKPSDRRAPGPNPLGKNPPLYYAYVAIPYRAGYDANVVQRLFAMRLWTGLMFIVTVALAWLLAAEIFTSVLLRTVATGVVVLHPVLAFESGIVNSDVMLTAVWTAFTLCAVRMVNRGPSPARAIGVFALAVLAVLTHGRGLPLVGAAVVALGLAWWRHRPPVRAGVVWAGAGAAVVAVGALVYKLALNRSEGGALYGGELHLGHFRPGQFANYLWQFYLPKLPGAPPRVGGNYGYRQFFIEKYFGTFGSLEIGFVADLMRLIQLLAFAGLVGLVVALIARRAELAPRWDIFALLAFIAGGCILFLHVVSYRAMVDGGGDPIIVGRYLLPLTPIFGLAVAFVVGSAGRRAGPYLAAFILALGVLLQLGGLGLTLDRFYG